MRMGWTRQQWELTHLQSPALKSWSRKVESPGCCSYLVRSGRVLDYLVCTPYRTCRLIWNTLAYLFHGFVPHQMQATTQLPFSQWNFPLFYVKAVCFPLEHFNISWCACFPLERLSPSDILSIRLHNRIKTSSDNFSLYTDYYSV